MMYRRQGSVNASVAYLTFKKVRKTKEVGSFICGLFNDSLSSLKHRVDEWKKCELFGKDSEGNGHGLV
jgi:hypothetical protein